MSATTCWRDHTFPWRYSELVVGAAGALACPSCHTDLNTLWSLRSVYRAPTY
jgi:hypothetical protein